MTASRKRWAIAAIAVVAELLSFAAWRIWVARHRSHAATA